VIEGFKKISPLRILEDSSKKGLGAGELGVVIARAGVGKTACLINFAFDTLFRNKKLVHISLEDQPEKVTSYYRVIFSDIVRAMGVKEEIDLRQRLEGNRMILAYLKQSFDVERLRGNLTNLKDKARFNPGILVLDGLDFHKAMRKTLEGLKGLAGDFGIGIWFSALSHRHITQVNERGIPHPCHEIDDLFSVIMQLQPEEGGVLLRLLKDREDGPPGEVSLFLDPKTFLVKG